MSVAEAPAESSAPGPGWIRRLGADTWRHKPLVIGSLAVTAVAAGIDSIFPLLTRHALDSAQQGDAMATITVVAILIAALALVRFACQYGRRILASKLSIDTQNDLRIRLLASLQRLDGRGQDSVSTGQVVSRSITDLQLVQSLLAMVPMTSGAALQFVVAIAIMVWLSPLLTVVTLVVVPAVAFVVRHYRPKLFAATWSAQQQAAELAQHVEETVTGVRVVKGFGQEAWAVDRLQDHSRLLYALRMRAARLDARFAPTMSTLPQFGLVAVILVGGLLALRGQITLGTFLAFSTYVTTMTSLTRILTQMLVVAQLSRAAVERVYEVTDAEPEIAEPVHPVPLPPGRLGLRFDDVHFSFEPGREVLRGLTLEVRPGERVAVVGPPGAGKTALATLAARFYAPESGRVELLAEGSAPVDIAELAAHDLRSAVTVAFDEPFLFSDTIAANIALGKPDATDEEIRAAAVSAQADAFIQALPDGYATTVGERGLTLSGGQRQRIALARALLLHPQVLVLDDATSAVDAQTEAAIYRELGATVGGSALILAHRRSTLVLADRVAVLDGGRIVDTGTVAELEARSPQFRALFGGTDGLPPAPPAEDAAVSEDALWPGVPDDGGAAAPTLASTFSGGGPGGGPGGGGPGGRGPGGGGPGGGLANVAATPELLAQVAALPPATDTPQADEREIRTEQPQFTLWSALRPVRWLLVAVIAALAFDSLVSVAFPSIVRWSIDRGVGEDSVRNLVLAAAVAFTLVALDWVVVAVMTVLTSRSGESVLYGLRVRSYAHLQRLGLDYYERELSGRIMTRMTTDVDALSQFIQTGLSTAVVALVTLIGIIVALLATDVVLALVALASLPPLIAATLVFRRVSSRAYTTSRERISMVNADFQESIAGLRAIQAYRREPVSLARFSKRADSYRRSRMRSQQAISLFFPFIQFLSDLALAAVIFVGAREVANGTTSPGVLVAFVLYLGLLFVPIQRLSQVFDGYQQASVGLRRIGDLLRTPSSIIEAGTPGTPGEHPVPITGHLRGDVAFADVGFRYAGAPTDALSDVELHLPPGTTLALVGPTGAGKSTIVKLLARFYDPTDGSVNVDDVDLRRYPLAQFRHRLGVVPQEAHLFTGTAATNIAFGRQDATRAEIEEAARAVGALGLIAGLSGGMEHAIGERGQGLSAGQRQLIALARAELVDPDVLLLDEATATLDPATEARVLAASRTVTRSRTSVIVAHRLASAVSADVVAVVDGGRIVERGSHETLLAAGGRYAALWAAAGEHDEQPGAE